MARRDLQPADRAMGPGPFLAKRGSVSAKLKGNRVISGVREIWVRDVYLKDDYLRIGSSDLVVDLGANMGNFTNLALAHGSGVRVVAVEPNLDALNMLVESVAANGWMERVVLNRCFLGGVTAKQRHLMHHSDYRGAQFVSQDDFLENNGVGGIDFLKCDIEGSEFELLSPDSPILKKANQIAIELHDWAGDRYLFIEMLRDCGFSIGPVREDYESAIVLAKR